MKICSRCGVAKEKNQYNRSQFGLTSHCKSCISQAKKVYAKTPEGKAAIAWGAMKARAGDRNGKNPTYAKVELRLTRSDFLAWAILAYRDWVADGLAIEDATVDRIRCEEHYEPGNLRLATKAEQNKNRKYNKNMRAPIGMAWCSQHKCYEPRANFSPSCHHSTGLQNNCRAGRALTARQRYQSQKS